MATWAIILAGGAGTRFWPASTAQRPKQLLALIDPHETLLEATIRRIRSLASGSRVTVATGAKLAPAVRRVVGREARIFAEPVPRNTAPCIAWITAAILEEDPAALCMVLPSDHAITDETQFRACAREALAAAREGFLATIGIQPTRPETGFGYIERGEELRPGVFSGVRFVEKPDRARAEQYMASGRFLWNAGMFFYEARVMMAAFERHAPEIAHGVAGLRSRPRTLARAFARLPSISVDHAIMEKAERVAVVPGDFGWSDLGSWQAAWELAPKDAEGNALPRSAVAIDSTRNLVWNGLRDGKERVYALVGVKDLVVVETDDAVLVAHRERAQDVKRVTEALASRTPPRARRPRRTPPRR